MERAGQRGTGIHLGMMEAASPAPEVPRFLLQPVDNIYALSMVSLSQQYAQAGGPNELFRTLAAAIGSTRRWAHLSELLAIDWWLFVFYSILYRFILVPRAVAAFGLLTVLLHFTGVPVRGFAGSSPVALMGMPMALSQLTLATWLVARGLTNAVVYLLVRRPRGRPQLKRKSVRRHCGCWSESTRYFPERSLPCRWIRRRRHLTARHTQDWRGELPMKQSVMLTIAFVLSISFMTFHL
ncbi:MAG: DUF4386 family protein, partial [Gemmatimonadales bacterium]